MAPWKCWRHGIRQDVLGCVGTTTTPWHGCCLVSASTPSSMSINAWDLGAFLKPLRPSGASYFKGLISKAMSVNLDLNSQALSRMTQLCFPALAIALRTCRAKGLWWRCWLA